MEARLPETECFEHEVIFHEGPVSNCFDPGDVSYR
jgi:hypothetical protein